MRKIPLERTTKSLKKEKIYAIAAFKNERQVGYLFWRSQLNSPKVLRVGGRASSQVATWTTYKAAEKALNDRMPGRLATAKDALEHEGYSLEIVEFG